MIFYKKYQNKFHEQVLLLGFYFYPKKQKVKIKMESKY